MESLIDILQKNITYLALNSFREYCMKVMHSIRNEYNVTDMSFDISSITPVPGKNINVAFEFHYTEENSESGISNVLNIDLDVPCTDCEILHYQEEDIKEIQKKLVEGLSLAFKDAPNFIVLTFSKLIGAYIYLGIADRRFDNGAIYHYAY